MSANPGAAADSSIRVLSWGRWAGLGVPSSHLARGTVEASVSPGAESSACPTALV